MDSRKVCEERAWRVRLVFVALLTCLTIAGCSGSRRRTSGLADSTGAIDGDLLNTFVHGTPFYGSVVCLVEVSPQSVEWWEGLARHRVPLVYPEVDGTLNVVGRTVCAPVPGHFVFAGVRPGTYFVYLWVPESLAPDFRIFWPLRGGDSGPLRHA